VSDTEQRSDPSTALRPDFCHTPGAGVFATTHWSVVLSARDPESPQSLEALETLCRAYWLPLYTYARGLGKNSADAEDLTQGFFAALLEKDFLRAAARERGKFRTFLKVAFKRYLANEWDRQHAAKRGGFAVPVSIDQDLAEMRCASELSHNLQPDVLFDRQWAMTLLHRTLARLSEEYVSSGRAKLFEHLQGCLVRSESELSYAEIAARLGLTEAAIKMAVQRLRVRYREILKAEISETVTSPEEADEEIQQLFSAFQT
jgi:RNA polymerase sigma-70 factor (ECF subfamily)